MVWIGQRENHDVGISNCSPPTLEDLVSDVHISTVNQA